MRVFGWIMGVLSAVLAAGAVGSFVVFMLRDGDEWIVLARRFRRWTTVALLFWFNVQIWGSVIYTLATW